MKATHAMVSEFTIHPDKIIDVDKAQVGAMSLTIPRLKRKEASSLRLANAESQKVIHYNGPSKVNPPGIGSRLLLHQQI